MHWWLRLRNRDRIERELDAELRDHLERLAAAHIGAGVPEAEAKRRARLEFGGVEQVKEGVREARRLTLLEDAVQDFGYALRTLGRNRGYATVAALTLAVGIGAAAAMFSVVNALLLKPLPYPDADRLVRLIAHIPPADTPAGVSRRVPASVDLSTLRELQSHSRTLSHAGLVGLSLVTMTGGSETARLQGTRASAAVFEMLGAAPLVGRRFGEADERPGAQPVMLLSHGTWLRYFGGAAAAVGRTVTLAESLGRARDPVQYVIVGVMPSDFAYPDARSEFWTPIAAPMAEGREPSGTLLARLAGHVSAQAAAAEVAALLRGRPGQPADAEYAFVREQDDTVAPVRPALLMLTIAVGFVLLIACVNVASLLLARMDTRQREIAIRLALGARRGRVIRHLLAESMLLALAGGAGGIALAFGGVRLLRPLATTLSRFDLGLDLNFPRLDEIGMDASVLSFALGASVLAGVACGLAPALRRTGADHLRVRDAGASAPPRFLRLPGGRVRNLLVLTQTALAVILLSGGGLLIHSFLRLSRVDLGYDASNVLTFQIALPPDAFPQDSLHTVAEDLVARLRRIPGVESAAYARQLPMVALVDTITFSSLSASHSASWKPGDPDLAGDIRVVSHGYLNVLRIPMARGRALQERDRAGGVGALLINQTLARSAFPDQDPIGLPLGSARGTQWEVVGVVHDVRQFAQDRPPEPQIFVDARQAAALGLGFPVGPYFLVRTRGEPMAAAPQVSRAAREVEPQAGVYNVVPLADIVSNRIARQRLYAVLLGVFAAIAVILAAVGLYGVMAYTVAQRTREIGVRVALGAGRRSLVGLVIRQSLTLISAGLVIGLAGAAALTRYLERMLFGVTPLDPGTFAAVTLLFLAVGLLASYVPTRRAARVDPLIALRCE